MLQALAALQHLDAVRADSVSIEHQQSICAESRHASAANHGVDRWLITARLPCAASTAVMPMRAALQQQQRCKQERYAAPHCFAGRKM